MNSAPMVLSTDLARVRGIYKLLPASPPLKVLEVLAPGQTPILCGKETAVDAQMVTAKIQHLGYETVECQEVKRRPLSEIASADICMRNNDLVILHGTIDTIDQYIHNVDANTQRTQVIDTLSSLLAPKGIIAGCFQNRLAVQRILRNPFSTDQPLKYTFLEATRLLDAGKFDKSRVFALYPGKDSPITLAEVNRKPSVAYSASQIAYLKSWFSRGNYYLKMLFSAFGVGLWFEDEYFFYAQQK